MLITFYGAENTGKSHVMMGVAKILGNMNRKLLIIDYTKSRGIISLFNIPIDEEQYDPQKDFILMREDLEIYVPKVDATDKDIEKIISCKKDYEYIFLETDSYMKLIEEGDKIFFVCNSDKKTYRQMKELFMQVEDKLKIIMIYNNIVDGKNYREYINSILFSDVPLRFLITTEDIFIPFIENDLLVSQAAKINGHYKLRPYSQDFKNAIFTLLNYITSIDQKEFRKILRKRSV